MTGPKLNEGELLIPEGQPLTKATAKYLRGSASKAREVLMTRSLAGDVRAAIKGSTPADAFNLHQVAAVRLAKAHTERLTFEALAALVDSCEDPATRAVLERVEDLTAPLSELIPPALLRAPWTGARTPIAAAAGEALTAQALAACRR